MLTLWVWEGRSVGGVSLGGGVLRMWKQHKRQSKCFCANVGEKVQREILLFIIEIYQKILAIVSIVLKNCLN